MHWSRRTKMASMWQNCFLNHCLKVITKMSNFQLLHALAVFGMNQYHLWLLWMTYCMTEFLANFVFSPFPKGIEQTIYMLLYLFSSIFKVILTLLVLRRMIFHHQCLLDTCDYIQRHFAIILSLGGISLDVNRVSYTQHTRKFYILDREIFLTWQNIWVQHRMGLLPEHWNLLKEINMMQSGNVHRNHRKKTHCVIRTPNPKTSIPNERPKGATIRILRVGLESFLNK